MGTHWFESLTKHEQSFGLSGDLGALKPLRQGQLEVDFIQLDSANVSAVAKNITNDPSKANDRSALVEATWVAHVNRRSPAPISAQQKSLMVGLKC